MRPALQAAIDGAADACERAIYEIVPLVRVLSPPLALGLASVLISVAEQLRGGVVVGSSASDVGLFAEGMIGRREGVTRILVVRTRDSFVRESRPLTPDEVEGLLGALVQAEREEREEHLAVLDALPRDLASWLADVAAEADATASPEERRGRGDMEPAEAFVEALTRGARMWLRRGGMVGLVGSEVLERPERR